ncbi:GtrA family protein [Streptococcus anginosus]|uniref:GtrA family protein n=1 Tax=Streptococcus anginosus TaxID=1328 RepID=UPI000E437D59|nr:GtrA family protein [Streptococcus anginosus]RGN68615.1 GtrA family protein [Streptococcus anginosus]
MKNYIKRFFNNEILSYLFFGVATTVVAVLTRMLCYALTSNELLATALGNIASILFAFATNDTIVFKQERTGWGARFVKFALARLSTFLLDMGLTLIFVTTFPNIIGQFVHNDIKAVNTIETLFAQIVIIVLNYVFSKVFVFKNKSKK